MDLPEYVKAERGRGAAIAVSVGVHPVMVTQWCSGTKPVPSDRCPDIERATGGRVAVEQMRPDVAWVRVPDPAWPHPDGRPCIDVAGQRAA